MDITTKVRKENESTSGDRSLIFFLCKFFEKDKYASDFLKGKLYANRLSYFRNLEEPDRVRRSDQHEGIIAWGQPGLIRVEINGHDMSNDLVEPAALSSDRLAAFHVICMHAGHIQSVDGQSFEDVTRIKQRLLIPEECKKFGQTTVVIKNPREFLNRIEAAAQLKSYREAHGLVEYYNSGIFSGFFPGITGAFKKQERFELEREYRIVLETGNIGTDAIVLDIGDIRDIAMRSTIDEINRNMIIQRKCQEL